MRGFVPDIDARVVRLLRDAGAVIVGKTVTHEFAYGQNIPPTRNPWDETMYPGGSRSGPPSRRPSGLRWRPSEPTLRGRFACLHQ